MATTPHNFTKEELELLSDEEREGLLEDIDNEGDDENGEGEGLEPGDTGTVDTSGVGPDPLKEAAENADDKTIDADTAVPEKKPVAELQATVTEEANEPAPAVVFPKYESPEVNREKVATLEEQIADVAAKFDDGELSAAEYRAQTKPIEAEVRKLERVIEKSEDLVATWTDVVVPNFFEANPKYKQSAAMYAELDKQVRAIQAESLNPFDPSILPRAHKAAVAEMRKAMGLPAEEPGKPAQKPGNKRDLPPSLANVPAADITETLDNNEFACLDRLQEKDGLAYETVLAKLTEDQMARYLAQ